MGPGGRERYRIDVRGPLPRGAAEHFPAMAVIEAGGVSTLTGTLADTAELYGLISRLEALGLTLLAIRPESTGSGAPEPDGENTT